ncbi:MAG: mechanosensitive ion channel family protein, partial [Muribaculaceae bacterium]|nr:mechanosensitive ion channel family protein [Muribaculaceae bacterium]
SWNIAISYGDNVEDARQAIMKIFSDEPRILTGTSPDMSSVQAAAISEFGNIDNLDNSASGSSASDRKAPKKPGFFFRLFHNRRRVENALTRWNASRTARLETLIPKVDFTPKVVVSELADSSVNLSARAWVNTPDYWSVFYDLNERFYTELPKIAGISFPFPQMDIHIQQPDNGANGENKN